VAEVRPGVVLADRFHVERVLSEGPSGVVAEAVEGDTRVVLRVIPPPVSSDAIIRADGTRKLVGEYVARVLEVSRMDDGSVVVVREWAEGEDLRSMLAARGPLAPEEAGEIVLQACAALAEAHKYNMLHGRLEPSKVVVGRGADGVPHVKVLGFDLGVAAVPGDPETRIDRGPWSWVRYAAPETMSTSRPPDPEADVWSLGALLYELATGRTPFVSETIGGLLGEMLTEPFESLASLRPELPKSYVSVAERSLHNDLERRCQDVSEISAVLATIVPKRARPIARNIELLLHGTLPSLQRIISQESRTERPAGPIARTVSRPPPALVRSTPPAAPEPAERPADDADGDDDADADDDAGPPAEVESGAPVETNTKADTSSSLNARMVGGVALAGVIAVGGVLALRARVPSPAGVGVTEPTSASQDAGGDAAHVDDEPAPMSSRRPLP
jgi:serine/threonine protein kinase